MEMLDESGTTSSPYGRGMTPYTAVCNAVAKQALHGKYSTLEENWIKVKFTLITKVNYTSFILRKFEAICIGPSL